MGSKILFNTVFINLEQVVHSGSFLAVYSHKSKSTHDPDIPEQNMNFSMAVFRLFG